VSGDAGKALFRVGMFSNSVPSKTCSACGYRKADLTLKDREWTCLDCGVEVPVVANAAIRISLHLQAMSFAREYGVITAVDYASIAPGVSDKTRYRDLLDLVHRGLLEAVGVRRGRKYVLARLPPWYA